MIWLQSNEMFDSLAQLDPSTGTIALTSRSQLQAPVPATMGFFSVLDGKFVALYRDGAQLSLRIGDQVIALASDVRAEVTGAPHARLLVVRRAAQVIASHRYSLDRSQQFRDDPTPFVENEDFDFGLFVANVSQSEKRQAVLLGLA